TIVLADDGITFLVQGSHTYAPTDAPFANVTVMADHEPNAVTDGGGLDGGLNSSLLGSSPLVGSPRSATFGGTIYFLHPAVHLLDDFHGINDPLSEMSAAMAA